MLYQFIGQDIEEEKQVKFMRTIISFYCQMLKAIYKSIAIAKKENADLEGGNAVPEQPESPISTMRMRRTSDSGMSYGQSTDFRHIQSLRSGIKKKQSFSGLGYGTLGTNVWQWSNSNIDTGITSQIIQEMPNLNRCMDFLVNYTGQNDSFNKTQNFADGWANNSFRGSTIAQRAPNHRGTIYLKKVQKENMANKKR